MFKLGLKQLVFVLMVFLLWFKADAGNDFETINNLTVQWNQANNDKNLEVLSDMYSANVLGYSGYEGKVAMIKAKRSFFAKNLDFEQAIVSDLEIKKFVDGTYLCEFVKRSTFNGRTKDYPSYLWFRELGGNYFIIEESDYLTNELRKYKLKTPEVKETAVVPFGVTRQSFGNWWLLIFGAIGLGILLFKPRSNSSLTLTGRAKRVASKAKSKETIYRQTDFNSMTNWEKGYEFEKSVVNRFNPEYFSIVRWQGDKYHEGRRAEETSDPDLVLRLETYSNGTHVFAVECKYRTRLSGTKFELCREDQLANYKAFGRKENMPVFIVLGVGGTPNQPDKTYTFNVKKLNSGILTYQQMNTNEKGYGSFFYSPENEHLG